MIRKTYTDKQIVDALIDRAIRVNSRAFSRQLNQFSAVSNKSFVAGTGTFGEFQQGVAVGFMVNYTRRD